MNFLHLSDIHIGLETHGRINPATGRNTRLEDILKCLDHAVDTAIEESLDVLLMAGDIFHIERTPARQRKLSLQGGCVKGHGESGYAGCYSTREP